MNKNYLDIIRASDDERAGLFDTTAQRIGTTAQNIEKDFWVCWTLDALFNGLPDESPRLLFKGGTSLSKGFGLIERFSEDIDITVFREDIGQAATIEGLSGVSGAKRKAWLKDIKNACQEYTQGPLSERLSECFSEAVGGAKSTPKVSIEIDTDDPDGQSLLVHYPPATRADGYVRQSIKIEAGAKSALDPHLRRQIEPYVAADTRTGGLTVDNVVTVAPIRTFWDKIIILHGLRKWHDRRGELHGEGRRVSRHYYDLHRLGDTDVGRTALAEADLGADCVAHARMFFDRKDYELDKANKGSFSITPSREMEGTLRRDYEAMATMIFGKAPEFDDVLASISRIESVINSESG